MGKHITAERTRAAAKTAAKNVLEALGKDFMVILPDSLVSCEYMGTVEDGAPLNSLTRLKLVWKVRTELFERSVEQEVHASRVLHINSANNGARLPRACKLPLRAGVLPYVIQQRKLLPGMSKYEELMVHGLAISKEISCEQEKVFAVHGGRRQEMLKCAHVSGSIWLCHPGGVLHPNGLAQLDLTDESLAEQPRGPIYRLQGAQQGDLLQKLYAVGHFKAELVRAKMEGRSVDLKAATEKFNVDAFSWNGSPKNVFVIWSHGSSEGWAHEVSEMPYKSLRLVY